MDASTYATDRLIATIPTVPRRRPRWLPAVAAIAGAALAAAAGNWQLDRAHEKERLQRAYDRGTADAPVVLSAAPVEAQTLLFRRIEATGEFVPRAAVLLDNKVLAGVAGYHVIVPLRIADSQKHVLVNRGWVAAGADRSRLPDVRTPVGSVTVIGIAVLPGRFLELSGAETTGPVWQNLTIERYRRRMRLDIQPVVIEQHNDLGDGLARSWSRADFGIARHYGYAVQWFSLCGLIAFLYVFFYVRRARFEKDEENSAPSGRG
ncbi:MAG TPA: SURF1 family protein [Burkholderiales bacterium]|jgi:surfeit locus 1 family protein|nr:SURF1 family protein [Burkholderiales bacterium]